MTMIVFKWFLTVSPSPRMEETIIVWELCLANTMPFSFTNFWSSLFDSALHHHQNNTVGRISRIVDRTLTLSSVCSADRCHRKEWKQWSPRNKPRAPTDRLERRGHQKRWREWGRKEDLHRGSAAGRSQVNRDSILSQLFFILMRVWPLSLVGTTSQLPTC